MSELYRRGRRDDVWWWEGTVAFRKIVIAGVAVFGSNLGMMQVHITSMLIATSLLFTAHVQPFGGENHELLQMLEMGSLMVTFLTLWCGGIFNSFPRCIDEDGNEMWWCNGMAVIVGLLVIGIGLVSCQCGPRVFGEQPSYLPLFVWSHTAVAWWLADPLQARMREPQVIRMPVQGHSSFFA